MDDTGNAVQVQAASVVSRSRRDPALLAGRVGRWRWPWVVVGTLAAITLMVLIGRLISPLEARLAAWYELPLDENIHFQAGRWDTFVAFVTFAFPLIAAIAIVLVFVHGQSWRAALGPNGRFDWSLFAKAAVALLIVSTLSSCVDYLHAPGSMRLVPHGLSHLPWLLLGALVILPQAFAEDFVFKGYLTRAWGAVLPYRLIIVPLCATAFTTLHAGNADVGADLSFNLAGFLLMEILAFNLFLRTGSLATATGLHWMNNVFAMCLVTTLPGQPGDFAVIEFQHPLMTAGVSKWSDPVEIVSVLAGTALLWALLSSPRSPLYLPSAKLPAPPPPTASPPSAPPGP